LPVIRIQELAEVMIQELAPNYGFAPEKINIEIIGTKPGEKMYEELMNTEETRRARELESYFVVLPAFTSIYRDISYEYPSVISETVSNPYHSDNEKPLSKGQLTQFLNENQLLEEDLDLLQHPAERYWPGNAGVQKTSSLTTHETLISTESSTVSLRGT
jgi:hypothetical protein